MEGTRVEIEESSEEEDGSSTASSSDESANESPTPFDAEQVNIPEPSLIGVQEDSIFLDITCMVAYVSSMTNGRPDLLFTKPIYNQQAEWERQNPAKPKLDSFFGRKRLVTCREALSDFQTLVKTIGGPGEKQRAEELIQRLHVVDDSPSERVVNLQLTSNVKVRSRIIFGTADQLRIVILTANIGFLRSAAGQVRLCSFCLVKFYGFFLNSIHL